MNRSRSVLNMKNRSDSNPINALDEENINLQTKTDLPEVRTQYSKSPFFLKLQKIIDELAQIDPDSLMQKVDPTINSTKTIKRKKKEEILLKKRNIAKRMVVEVEAEENIVGIVMIMMIMKIMMIMMMMVTKEKLNY